MLYKCANEACSAPFRKLREGSCSKSRPSTSQDRRRGPSPSDVPEPPAELSISGCVTLCSPYLTLTVDRQRGVVTVPLPDGLGQKTVRVLALDTPGQAVESSTYQHGLHEVQK